MTFTKRINVLGIDPSLRNWAMVAANIRVKETGNSSDQNKFLGLCLSKKEKKLIQLIFDGYCLVRSSSKVPKNQYVNEYDTNCALDIYRETMDYAAKNSISFIVAESPVGSQSASAMKSYGICIGVLGALSASYPIWTIRARQSKLDFANDSKATKDDMITASEAYFELHDLLPKNCNGDVIKSRAEHIVDAGAAIYSAAIDDDFHSWMLPHQILRE